MEQSSYGYKAPGEWPKSGAVTSTGIRKQELRMVKNHKDDKGRMMR
jgi:hypothetical protein